MTSRSGVPHGSGCLMLPGSFRVLQAPSGAPSRVLLDHRLAMRSRLAAGVATRARTEELIGEVEVVSSRRFALRSRDDWHRFHTRDQGRSEAYHPVCHANSSSRIRGTELASPRIKSSGRLRARFGSTVAPALAGEGRSCVERTRRSVLKYRRIGSARKGAFSRDDPTQRSPRDRSSHGQQRQRRQSFGHHEQRERRQPFSHHK